MKSATDSLSYMYLLIWNWMILGSISIVHAYSTLIKSFPGGLSQGSSAIKMCLSMLTYHKLSHSNFVVQLCTTGCQIPLCTTTQINILSVAPTLTYTCWLSRSWSTIKSSECLLMHFFPTSWQTFLWHFLCQSFKQSVSLFVRLVQHKESAYRCSCR